MTQANQADFFGETAQGGFDQGIEGDAPAMSAEDLALTRARKKAWLENQGLDENGNPLPAYGTSQGQGGTATGFQVATQPIGASGQVGDVWSTQLGSQDQTTPGAPIREDQYTGGRGPAATQTVGSIVPGQELVGSIAHSPLVGSQAGVSVASDGTTTLGGSSPGGGTTLGGGRGAILNAQSAQGVNDLRTGLAEDQALATDELRGTMSDVGAMNPLTNRALTQTAANQASSALGPAPTLDQGLADRGMRAVTDATRQAGQVVDAALAPVNQAGVEQAMGSARDVLDSALNGPDTQARLGSQVLRNQLALARSAAGGAGAAQQALANAQAMAPELQAQAGEAATREQLAKLGVASQQTGQLAQTALGQQQSENQRLDVAGKAAGVSAQASQGARGQDIEIAKANQSAAQNLMNNVAQLTGQQLQLNQQNQELLGQMARDLAAQNFDWSQLDVQTQDAEFERWVKTYGIDVAAAAQIRAAAENNDKGVMDYLMPIIGGAAAGLL